MYPSMTRLVLSVTNWSTVELKNLWLASDLNTCGKKLIDLTFAINEFLITDYRDLMLPQ